MYFTVFQSYNIVDIDTSVTGFISSNYTVLLSFPLALDVIYVAYFLPWVLAANPYSQREHAEL